MNSNRAVDAEHTALPPLPPSPTQAIEVAIDDKVMDTFYRWEEPVDDDLVNALDGDAEHTALPPLPPSPTTAIELDVDDEAQLFHFADQDDWTGDDDTDTGDTDTTAPVTSTPGNSV